MVDSQKGIGLGVVDNTILIQAVDNPVLADTADVKTGSTINGIFLNIEVYATTSGALSNVYLAVIKNPGNNISMPNPNSVGSSDNKRFVIHQEMVMLQKVTNSNPRTLFKGVVVIPRGYRRFAPEDNLIAKVLAPGVNIDLCLQCHYKEFS